MTRPQFSIRTLLWLTLAVAAFLGGMFFENAREKRKQPRAQFPSIDVVYGVHEIDLEDSIDRLAKQLKKSAPKQGGD